MNINAHLREEVLDLREENERLRDCSVDLTCTFREIERQVIQAVIKRNKGNKSAAARDLQIGIRTIQRKCKQWGTT